MKLETFGPASDTAHHDILRVNLQMTECIEDNILNILEWGCKMTKR